MGLLEAQWNRIRHQFSEEEKAALRRVIEGTLVDPQRRWADVGWSLGEERLEAQLRNKIMNAVRNGH